ncbi:MAG: acyloxyacyl hydrolase [Spartobacteria bacterium]
MNRLFGSFALVFFLAVTVRGGQEEPVAVPPVADHFARGSLEVQNVVGTYFFFDTGRNNRPSVDFALNSTRLGIMLSNPHSSGLLAGNFELLGEIFGGGIFQGPGNVMAGATLLFRYNFVQPQARVLPYLQIGAGGVYTDILEKESRGLISLPVEFNLQGTVGTRIMLNDRWSVVVEGVYRHVSNAEIKKPNFGIDAAGGNVGFGFFF